MTLDLQNRLKQSSIIDALTSYVSIMNNPNHIGSDDQDFVVSAPG